MTTPAIRVEGLWKEYLMGEHDLYDGSFREALTASFRVPLRWLRGGQNGSRQLRSFWALQDVSFSVAPGEVVGIIGRNGAGKTTLLRILSKITPPTRGRVELLGRLGSLLEVGTGFHPELTGRENIYINGSILGMRRSDIRRKFDEIVAFAEVAQFLDTPVKRYSTGMAVRLAFSIAAHLEPEVLLVDEVLAVGDVQFQHKCLGKMGEVSRQGRTVLFVSHNLGAIERLAPKSLLLDSGKLATFASTRDVLSEYLSDRKSESMWELETRTDREGNGRARVTSVRLLSEDGSRPVEVIGFGEAFRVRIEYSASENIVEPTLGLGLLTERDERVFLTSTLEAGVSIPAIKGRGSIDCVVRRPNVLPGTYRLEVWISDIPNKRFADHLRMVGRIEIVPHSYSGSSITAFTYRDRGRVYIECDWLPGSEDYR
jgi:lipopolysaccharide transport system ATP-binding protein